MTDHAETLASQLMSLDDGFLLVVTGAGISLASGIPTFRGTDPDAVWSKDVTELGTFRYFREDPVGSWRWYLSRFANLEGKEPNAAHAALVELERWQAARGEFLLVTQNIDGLHRRAGAERLVEVHGMADRVRCATHGCENGSPEGWLPRAEIDQARFLANPCETTLPRCARCGDVLRQHLLWFDETYDQHVHYQWERVREAASRADLVVFIGTSLSVGVTELILRAAASRRRPVILIDPGEVSPHMPLTHLPAKSEELLPQVLRLLAE